MGFVMSLLYPFPWHGKNLCTTEICNRHTLQKNKKTYPVLPPPGVAEPLLPLVAPLLFRELLPWPEKGRDIS